MKRQLFFLILAFTTTSIPAQNKNGIPYAMFRGCENHSGVYESEGGKTLGDVKWKFKTSGKIFSSPAIYNGFAFIGSEDKHLYAIDITTGRQKWKFATGGAVHSSPAVYKDVVYFGSFDGYYYAVDINTGKEKWKFKTGGEKWIGSNGYWGMKPADLYMEDPWDCLLSSPVIDVQDKDPTLYFGSSDGHVYAVNANDGSLRWKFATKGSIHTSPALYNGTIYIGSWDTYLYAIDARTGKEQWKFKTGSEPINMSGIQASPTVVDDVVYFGARDAHLYALKANTGELVWKYFADNSWIIGTAAIKDGVLYVGTSDSFLFLALDANTGKEKFRFKANGYIFSSPAIAGSTAYFGDFTGKLFALDLNSEGKKWTVFSTERRTKNAATVLNKDQLDFQYASKGSDLYIYANNVKVMDEFYSLGPIVSSPFIKNRVIYFGCTDGYFYALNLR